MKKVHRRLEQWRRQRTGRERIPPALRAAGELAREHGAIQVSRVLHLEFNQLKRAAEGDERNGRKQTTPTFVELVAPQTSAGRECILEVEGRRWRQRNWQAFAGRCGRRSPDPDHAADARVGGDRHGRWKKERALTPWFGSAGTSSPVRPCFDKRSADAVLLSAWCASRRPRPALWQS